MNSYFVFFFMDCSRIFLAALFETRTTPMFMSLDTFLLLARQDKKKSCSWRKKINNNMKSMKTIQKIVMMVEIQRLTVTDKERWKESWSKTTVAKK